MLQLAAVWARETLSEEPRRISPVENSIEDAKRFAVHAGSSSDNDFIALYVRALDETTASWVNVKTYLVA